MDKKYPPYCIEDRRYANTLWDDWKNGMIQFCDDNIWDYSFDNELSGKEVETTPLSKLIWMQILEYNEIEVEEMQDGKHTNTYFLTWEKKGYTQYIHFDIMNNPKLRYSISSKLYETDYASWNKWVKLYHTIGNFCPIFWVSAVNLQAEHLYNDERWDQFLSYLQKNWNNWFNKFSFEEYLKVSVMWVYVKEKYEEFKENILQKRTIQEISDEEWLNFYNEMDFTKQYTFINLEENSMLIPELIEYRGRCILALCRKNKEEQKNR